MVGVLLLGLRIYSGGRLYLVPSLLISSTFIHISMLALVQSFLSSIKICKQQESSINLVCLGTTWFHKQLACNKYSAAYVFAYLTYARQVLKIWGSLTTLRIWGKSWVFSPEKIPKWYTHTNFCIWLRGVYGLLVYLGHLWGEELIRDMEQCFWVEWRIQLTLYTTNW